jgi:hypothetical protein
VVPIRRSKGLLYRSKCFFMQLMRKRKCAVGLIFPSKWSSPNYGNKVPFNLLIECYLTSYTP